MQLRYTTGMELRTQQLKPKAPRMEPFGPEHVNPSLQLSCSSSLQVFRGHPLPLQKRDSLSHPITKGPTTPFIPLSHRFLTLYPKPLPTAEPFCHTNSSCPPLPVLRCGTTKYIFPDQPPVNPKTIPHQTPHSIPFYPLQMHNPHLTIPIWNILDRHILLVYLSECPEWEVEHGQRPNGEFMGTGLGF